ncbi:exosortase-associated protein EpsI, B-type [Rugamonas sp.]|uniref:exosortase-associated protein EpsI, B-type n=1 Tax=Rugamonas sp. TaxID=1926287 RepID=UPI0025D4A107|nr:exosortase-associated protein EpsI, B-type [Rugamonas sp.]
MNRSTVASIVLGLSMVVTSAVTQALKPTHKMADQKGRFDLETMIPLRFGDWTEDNSIVPLKVDPSTQARLNMIYNQTLSRTYIDSKGERIMLSIAYGGDQSDNMAVHRPELCYVAQGFNVTSNNVGALPTAFGTLPVRRLVAVQGARNEPITYWITVGDRAINPGMSQRLQQLRYGFTGNVPDGMLVRVSSIDNEAAGAYQLQQHFIADMLAGVSKDGRARLIGSMPL